MSIKVETLRLQNSVVLRYVKAGRSVGRKAFLREGFVQAPNPEYLIDTYRNLTAHYNHIMKVWIIE